jgi:hypothetical protein
MLVLYPYYTVIVPITMENQNCVKKAIVYLVHRQINKYSIPEVPGKKDFQYYLHLLEVILILLQED